MVSLPRLRTNKLVLADGPDSSHAMFRQCRCHSIAQTSLILLMGQKAFTHCSDSIVATASTVSLPRIRTNKPVLADGPESPHGMFQQCCCHGFAQTSLFLLLGQKALTQCNVPTVSLPRLRTNKLVRADGPESPHAMFRQCGCHGFAQTSLFVLMGQKALTQCSDSVVATASQVNGGTTYVFALWAARDWRSAALTFTVLNVPCELSICDFLKAQVLPSLTAYLRFDGKLDVLSRV